jgi:hypothetical protein
MLVKMPNLYSYYCKILSVDYNKSKVLFHLSYLDGKHIIKKKCWNIIIGISEIKCFSVRWNALENILLPVLQKFG